MAISKKDLPAYVRRCWRAAQDANKENRNAEIERLKFYVGGDLQWDPQTLRDRGAAGRPHITVNKCKPPVDQIEGDIRMNPPGPQVFPVGGGSDADTADIAEGMIREVCYRCHAEVAFSTAGKYVAASGFGVMKLGTEYDGERSFSQRVTLESVEDPSVIFYDPGARRANREDAMWAGELKSYSREEYESIYGSGRKVLKSRSEQSQAGWISDAMGTFAPDNVATADFETWSGGGEKIGGRIYVAEFSVVEFDRTKLRMASNKIAYFEDEKLPTDVTFLDGAENIRSVGRRKIMLYTVDAFETLDDTEWLGSLHRWIPVLGPEVYIEGKLHRLSLISGAIDAQQALNFAATSLTEVIGYLPKSPFVGWEGQFQNANWQDANTQMYAYLEVTPTFAVDGNGNQTLLSAPQRNMWSADVQWLIEAYSLYSDAIKSVTNVYDPSLGAQKGDQSGKAIEQLRSESNVGNFSYADNLHRAIAVVYGQMIEIFPKIYDGERVITIVRPDSEHELVTINRTFHAGQRKPGDKALDITTGQHGVRATVGPNFETSRREAREQLTEFIKAYPQAMQIPGFASNYLRLIGDGDDKVQQMADVLDPKPDEAATPEQMQMQLKQATAQNQQLKAVLLELQHKLTAQLPKVEADKFKAILDAATKIRVAQITASKDLDRAAGDREASLLETQLGMAHDAALQATDQSHQVQQQQSDQQHAAASQASDQAAAAVQQQSAQQAQQSEAGE